MSAYTIDRFDHDDGAITYHVCRNGQTVCCVDEWLFDEPYDAMVWADRIKLALVQLERAVR